MLILVCSKDDSECQDSFVEQKLVLFAASNVEDEEEITDAFYTSGLKEDEGMKVLGGGTLAIDNESETVTVTTESARFGSADFTLVTKILQECYEDFKIVHE